MQAPRIRLARLHSNNNDIENGDRSAEKRAKMAKARARRRTRLSAVLGMRKPSVTMVSLSNLRRKLNDDDDADPDVQVFDLMQEKIKMKAFRKRMHWKWRNWCDEKGFPQEISLEEYAERREKDPEKFAEEYPSILWQEERTKRIEREALEKQRQEEKEARRLFAEEAIRRQKLDAHSEKMRLYIKRHNHLFDIEDQRVVDQMVKDKERVLRLEEFENARHANEVRDRLAKEAKEKQEAEEKLAWEREKEEVRLENIRRDNERIDQELTDRVQAIMISSGTTEGKKRTKRPFRSPESITVRFVGEVDSLDAGLLQYNIFPLADYVKRFPRAKDASKQFPHLFLTTTTKVIGHQLGAEGTGALARALSAGAFPRMQRLRLNWCAMEFAGCNALAKAINTGQCAYLVKLSLRGNALGCGSVKALAEALEKENVAPKLTTIDLAKNRIACDGAKAIAHLLLNPVAAYALASIDLDSNQVCELGAHALARAARVRTQVAEIRLTSNRIPRKDMQKLRNLIPISLKI